MSVPKYNFLAASVNKNTVTLGELNFTINQKLPDKAVKSGQILAGLAPDKLYFEQTDEDMLEISADIEFFDDMQTYKMVYLKTPQKDGLLAVKADNSYKAKSGAKVSLYFKPGDVKLFDANGFLLA